MNRRKIHSTMQYARDSVDYASHLLLVGGGPRTIIQLNSEILFMIIYQHHFEALARLGARYNIETTIVEKQKVVGVGRSFNDNQTGMMNTGVESDISFPLPVPFEGANLNQLMSFLSYTHRYENLIGPNSEAYYEHVKHLNLPGAMMFKNSLGPESSTQDGKLEHQRAYLLRRTVGQEEVCTSNLILKLAESMLPFYNVQVLPSSMVRRIDISNIERPTAFVENLADGREMTIEASQIRLNSGTTVRDAVCDPRLQRLTFCQAMNAEHFKAYCAGRGLLGTDGLLKGKVKIISGGIGLSGLDQITVLDHVMKLFEEDGSSLGFRVREAAKQKYANAITIVSRTASSACPPRHSFTFEWQQDTKVLGSAKHLHGLFLHNYGEEVFRTWMTIIQAAVARARNVTFESAGCNEESLENLLRSQFEESMWFMNCRKSAGHQEKLGDMSSKKTTLRLATQTLYGAWRQAALGTLFGVGLDADANTAIAEMRELAPSTWKGREFFLYARGQAAAISHPTFAKEKSNADTFKKLDFLMKHVTSAPVEMHSMLHLLIDAGILQHVKGSYTDIRPVNGSSKMNLAGALYDLFIVSPVFDRTEDKAELSVAKQVQHFDHNSPSYGLVGRHRRFVNKEGECVSVEDYGLGGKGFLISTDDGEISRAGCFAFDVNNRSSAVSIASSLTLRRMAQAHLSAVGISHPHKVLDGIYENAKAPIEMFNAEVQTFRHFYNEAMEIGAYLEAIIQVCGDDALLFRMLYDEGLTRSGRHKQMRRMSACKMELGRTVARRYFEKVERIPVFSPPSRDDYLARFVDNTEEEDVFMYKEAMRLAKEHISAGAHGYVHQ